ncbi:hypothetical protein Gotur_013709 [Gossypium turneri]
MAMDLEPESMLSWNHRLLGGLVGPWIIYEQYLTVQHWSPNFNPMKPYSGVVKAWTKFPGLSDFLYKRRILEETEGTIGKVTKLGFNTDSGTRGKFARLPVYVDLDNSLIS